MKKFFVLGAAVAALALPALADVQVKDILINQVSPKAESTNIRVNLHNNGVTPARISSVDLQVRAHDGESWQTIKSFDNKNYLKIMPHKNLALDYLPARGESVNPTILQPEFQVRALVNGPGMVMTSAERPYSAVYGYPQMPR